MNRQLQRFLCLSALGTFCGVPALLAISAVESNTPTILAQASVDGDFPTRAIRSASEARAALGSTNEAAASDQLARMLKVSTIDWNRQMVILVSGGTQPTSGYSIRVDELSVAGRTLTVHWRLSAPGPDDGVLTVLTHPVRVLLCERFEGAVRFEQSVQTAITVVNFDGLHTGATGLGGAALANYLAAFGIRVESITQGTELQVVDARRLYEGKAVVAASPHNLLSQFGSNGPVSFTLRFDPPLAQLEFTRPGLTAATTDGVTHPAWIATALDAAGNPLDSVGRNLIASYLDVPAARFTLWGPGIAAVRFESNGHHFAGFSAVLLDDLILTR